MDAQEFKVALDRLGLSQVELARLIDVSPRSVTRWATGGEALPGPVQAYLRVLQMAPSTVRGFEFARARRPPFRDGIYQLVFEGTTGAGSGTLVFSGGRIWGADTGGLHYDGTYIKDDANQAINLHVTLSAPKGGELVTGVTLAPGAAFDIDVSSPFFSDEITLPVQTPYGSVLARLTFLRPTV